MGNFIEELDERYRRERKKIKLRKKIRVLYVIFHLE